MSTLKNFMAVDGDTLILRGHAARVVIYSALVTALVANEENHPTAAGDSR